MWLDSVSPTVLGLKLFQPNGSPLSTTLNRSVLLLVSSLLVGLLTDLVRAKSIWEEWRFSFPQVGCSSLVAKIRRLIADSLPARLRHQSPDVDDGKHGLRYLMGYHADLDHRLCCRDLSNCYERVLDHLGLDVLGFRKLPCGWHSSCIASD